RRERDAGDTQGDGRPADREPAPALRRQARPDAGGLARGGARGGLQPVLQAELSDEVELRLEPVDVLLLRLEDVLEQLAGDVVLDRLAMRDRLLQHRAGDALLLQVALERLLRVLA